MKKKRKGISIAKGFLLIFIILIMSWFNFTNSNRNEPSYHMEKDIKKQWENTDSQDNTSFVAEEESKREESTIDIVNNEEDEAKETLQIEASVSQTPSQAASLIIGDGNTIVERFQIPEGYIREESPKESFAYYLQHLPLKPHGSKVKYHDGREKLRDVYLAVVDFTLGERDLQQCADAIMRLRAEYLYEKERYDEIQFHFVSGFLAKFSKWADGNGISVKGNNVSWISNSKNNGSYDSFGKYLDIVYAYSSTLSLDKELTAKSLTDIAIGDVFIKGGSPGHCVIVVDMAIHKDTGEKIFMLAQSYMPAQDIQILRGESTDSPWYSANIEGTLKTPEWNFDVSSLKTWE